MVVGHDLGSQGLKGKLAELLRHQSYKTLEMSKDGRDFIDLWGDSIDVLSLGRAVPALFGFEHDLHHRIEHSVEIGIGLIGPYVAVVLDQGVTAVKKLQHSEQSKTGHLLHLVTRHDVRVFWCHLPEESELDNGQLAALELGLQKALEERSEVFDKSQQERDDPGLQVTQGEYPPQFGHADTDAIVLRLV